METSTPRPQLGTCLKAARRVRGMTLKEVAARTGMALSTLSKVENHQMSLTYDKLLQLSGGLGMEIAELFQLPGAAPVYTARRSVSRAGQGHSIQTQNYAYLYQCTDLLGKRMVPIVTEITARTLEAFGPLIRHAGEEYFLVIEGRIDVHTEFYGLETLEQGDAIYLDSAMGHAYLNAGRSLARAICVCSGDTTDLYEQLAKLARLGSAPSFEENQA